MKTLYTYLIIVTSIFLFNSCEIFNKNSQDCGLEKNIRTESVNYKILFIGNSHTYVNDVPQTIRKMAINDGDTVQTYQETPGGCTLKRHSKRKQTLDAINSKKWDYVIIQGVGGLQAIPPNMTDTAFNQYAQVLTDSIRSNSSGTKIILYMTHGYVDGVLAFNDYDWCSIDTFVCDYNGMQERIRTNYISLGNILDSEVAPCGLMWKLVMDDQPDINLHSSDKVHATVYGSYISALTLYTTIFNKNPENHFVPKDIDEDKALLIQQIVSKSLFNCEPNWETYHIK